MAKQSLWRKSALHNSLDNLKGCIDLETGNYFSCWQNSFRTNGQGHYHVYMPCKISACDRWRGKPFFTSLDRVVGPGYSASWYINQSGEPPSACLLSQALILVGISAMSEPKWREWSWRQRPAFSWVNDTVVWPTSCMALVDLAAKLVSV